MSEDTPLFPHHTQVMDYLTHVVASENLLPLIRFCTLVENVEYIDDVWKVTVNDKKENRRYTEEFDAIIVATGHYSVPQIPNVPGLVELNKSKNIQVVHSRDYRCPDNYKDKVGDIARHKDSMY
jgi:cation diffusion facilitator CzcD-associated flavoprotein CzcO